MGSFSLNFRRLTHLIIFIRHIWLFLILLGDILIWVQLIILDTIFFLKANNFCKITFLWRWFFFSLVDLLIWKVWKQNLRVLNSLVSKRIRLIKATMFVARFVLRNQHICKIIHAADSLENWNAIVTADLHTLWEFMVCSSFRSLASESMRSQTTTCRPATCTVIVKRFVLCFFLFVNVGCGR